MQELWRWTYLNRSLRKQPTDMTNARVMEVDIPEQKFEETTDTGCGYLCGVSHRHRATPWKLHRQSPASGTRANKYQEHHM